MNKELLFKDISARLLYGVICKVEFKDSEGWKVQNMSLKGVFIDECYFSTDIGGSIYSKEFKPYLRTMSSMTEEEMKENQAFFNYDGVEYPDEYVDWLNKNMFDYRGLIPMGLALEAPKDMYNIKEKYCYE